MPVVDAIGLLRKYTDSLRWTKARPRHPRKGPVHRCRFSVAEPFVESLGSRFRSEVRVVEVFDTLVEACGILED